MKLLRVTLTAVLLPTIIGLASGCASKSKKECETSDWQKIGLIDGRHGELATHVSVHENECGDYVKVDKGAYERGRIEGLNDYCTASGGYRSGKSGEPYLDVCSPEKEKEFLPQYKSGHETYLLMVQRREAQKRLDDRKKELEDDHSVVGDIAKGFSVINGKSQTQSEQDRLDDLDDKIYKNERLAPAGAVSANSYGPYDINPISLFRGFAGFGVGFVIGFGAGHAIQGHYAEDGWKWTAIDAALITELVIVSHNCPSRGIDETGHELSSDRAGCSPLMAAGVIGIVASHIMQGIGTASWMLKSMSRYNETTSAVSPRLEYVSVIPVDNAPGVGAFVSF